MKQELREIIHIGFECPEDFHDLAIQKIEDEIKVDGLIFHVHKRQGIQMMASLEWAIPTALGVYILKSYFDGFLTEMGKEHYSLLKEWLKKQADRSRLIQVHTITDERSTDKVSRKYVQSKAFSISFQIKDGRVIKLLFNNELSKEQWDNAVEDLCNLVLENYRRYPIDSLTQKLAHLSQDSRFRIYAIINKSDGELRFYDDTQLPRVME